MKLISLRCWSLLILLSSFGVPGFSQVSSVQGQSAQEADTPARTRQVQLEQQAQVLQQQLAQDRAQWDSQLQAYLATAPDATYDELGAMQAAFIRANFEQYLELESKEQEVRILQKAVSRAAKRSSMEIIEANAETQQLGSLKEAYINASRKLLRLESEQ
ncbi:MAG: hypothetical protein Q7P63_12325 [Verrucomicrobiota bacterium JB022]|nr:hypothetical protein [Verrucomicrobiota bacterium JB022]